MAETKWPLPDRLVAAVVSAIFAASIALVVTKVQEYRANADAEPSPNATSVISGDGLHLLGGSFTAGTYISEGTRLCYWGRVAGTEGQTPTIVQEQVTDSPATVTMQPTDYALRTLGCGNWGRIK